MGCNALHTLYAGAFPPMPKIRTTLTIDEDVLARYQRFADMQGESLSATVSGWLDTSAESAELLAVQIAKVKRSANPARAARQLAQSLQVVEDGFAQVIRKGGGASAEVRGAGAAPPSCNTGGKVPKTRAAVGAAK